jgi:pentatricopeptide repeat domain-containing protein 1
MRFKFKEMSSLSNAGFGCLENYVSDVAVTVMVGLGYYLFKGLKRKNEDFFDPEAGFKNLKPKLVNALEKWQYAKTIEEFNEIIKSKYNREGIEDPFSILNMLNKKGIIPNIDTYNSLLLNCYQKDNDHYAEMLKEEIIDPCGPVTPNDFTLNVLIKGLNLKYKNLFKNQFTTNKNFNKEELFNNFDHELMRLITLLEDRNIYMDLIGQNTILDSLVDQGRLKDAWSQYTNMKRKFKADINTYSIILRGIKNTPELSEDWLDKSFTILNEAKNTNEIDEQFLNSLLDSCVKFNRIDKAETLFNDYENIIAGGALEDKKKRLTEHSYCIMIKGYAKTYNLEKAERMFAKVKEVVENQGEKMNVISYGAMLNAFTRCKNIEKAERLLEEMENNKIDINSHIYSNLINGYRITRKYEKAIALFDSIMIKRGKIQNEVNIKEADNNLIKPVSHNLNIFFYNAILDCCVESNKTEKITEIYEYLELNQTNENFNAKIDMITYSILIKAYAKSGKIEKVTELYAILKKREDFKLDETLFNTIMDSYAKNNDEVNAIKIMADMKTLKIRISVVTFGIMIKLYINLNNITKTFELFEECSNQGIKPSVVIYQMLVKILVKNNYIEKAIGLFKEMINNEVKADTIIMEFMIKSCLENSRQKEAGDFILFALNNGIRVENYVFSYYVEKLESDNSNFKCEKEKKDFIPKLIEAIATKSANVELQSLNILRKINLLFNNSNNRINAMHAKSLGEKTIPSNSSIYDLAANLKTNDNTNNITYQTKPIFSGNYTFSSSQGISDLKGFYKNYVTVKTEYKDQSVSSSSEIYINNNENNLIKSFPNNIAASPATNENNNKSYTPLNLEKSANYVPTHLRKSNLNNNDMITPPVQNSKYNFNTSPNQASIANNNVDFFKSNYNYSFNYNSNFNNNQKPYKKGFTKNNNNTGKYTGDKSIYG